MKKRLMLIVLVFGMASLSISAESFSQRVLANIQPALQVIWPEAELSFGQLTIGLNESTAVQLKVLANVGYSIALETNSPYLKEYIAETATYGVNKLKEALQISVDDGVSWLVLEKALVLVSKPEGSPVEDVYKIKYQQVMSFPADKALNEGSYYTTEITLLVTPLI